MAQLHSKVYRNEAKKVISNPYKNKITCGVDSGCRDHASSSRRRGDLPLPQQAHDEGGSHL
jgi:hypothetical protein